MDEMLQEQERLQTFEAVPVKSESLTWKTLKLGAFYALTGMAVKKFSRNTGFEEYSNLISMGTVSTATLLNNDEGDDNLSKDLMALGAVFGISAGGKMFKDFLLSDEKTFSKVYEFADKADEQIRKAKIVIPKIYDDTVSGITTRAQTKLMSKDNTSPFSLFANVATSYTSALFETFSSGISQLFDKKLGLYDELYQSSDFYAYTKSEQHRDAFNIFKSYYKTKTSLSDFTTTELDGLMNSFKSIFDSNLEETMNTQAKMKALKNAFKNLERYEKIDESSYFKNLLGEYSTVVNGKVEANISKVVSDNLTNLSGYNFLFNKFAESNSIFDVQGNRLQSDVLRVKFIDWLKTNTTDVSSELDDAHKILANKMISFYNNPEDVKVGALSQFIGKKFEVKRFDKEGNRIYDAFNKSEELDANIVDYIVNSNKSNNEIFEVVSKEVRDQNNNFISNVYEITGIKNIDVFEDFALTNIFSKQDGRIIDKTALDPFNSFINTMGVIENAIPAFYNPNNPFMKNKLRLWNPLSLIDSRNRKRQHIVNDIQRMSLVREDGEDLQTLLIDGIKFQTIQAEQFKNSRELKPEIKRGISILIKNSFYKDNESISHFDIDENFDNFMKGLLKLGQRDELEVEELEDLYKTEQKLEMIFEQASIDYSNKLTNQMNKGVQFGEDAPRSKNQIRNEVFKKQTHFYTDSRQRHKNYFVKQIVSAATEEASFLNKNYKTPDLELKGKSFKEKIKAFVNSDYNYTPFRYDANGFYISPSEDEYFKEHGTLLHNLAKRIIKVRKPFSEKEIDVAKMDLVNKKIGQTITDVLETLIDPLVNKQEIHPDYAKELLEGVQQANIKKYLALRLGKFQQTKKISETISTIVDNDSINEFQLIERVVANVEQMKDTFTPAELKSLKEITDNAKGMFIAKYYAKVPEIDEITGNIKFSKEEIIKKANELRSGWLDDFNDSVITKFKQEASKKIAKSMATNIITKNQTKTYENIADVFRNQGLDITDVREELVKFDKILKDYFNARNLAIQDTYVEGKRFSSYAKYSMETMSKFAPLTKESPLDEKFKINLANRLYNVFMENQDFFNDNTFNNADEQKKLLEGYGIFRNLEVKMTNFEDLERKRAQAMVNHSNLPKKHLVTTFNDLSMEEKVKLFNQRFYRMNQKESSSVILRNSINFDLTLKELFEELRTIIGIGKNSKGTIIDPQNNFTYSLGYRKSFNFYKTDNFANVFMKGLFSNFEDSLEVLGISRIQNNLDRKINWTTRFKDIMLKRVAPIFATYLAYQATDSFVDAVLPDEVPLIGKGPTATLATGVAGTRVAFQYGIDAIGITSLARGLDSITNGALSNFPLTEWLTMNPTEMKDIFFNGKAVRVNKNRFWFTAGRQSGGGEEFDQYRPHILYTAMNPTTGVRAMDNGYLGKWQKFLRKDLLLTKYPWYIVDPYREERIAYNKYGAVYPVTEQLFKDIPIVGDFLSATIGNIIKPTRYIGEDKWLKDGKFVKNPKYNPNDPTSPEYIEVNKIEGFGGIIPSLFGAIEDIKTFSGLRGFAFGKATDFLFGKSNPYEQTVTLSSISDNISYQTDYDKYNLGGFFDMTEPVRRMLDEHNSLKTIRINPLEQRMPYYIPDYFKKGNNPVLNYSFGSYIMPTEDFNNTINHTDNDNLNRFRVLSMISPKSKEFEDIKKRVMSKLNDLTSYEKAHYYESLGYAEEHGTRRYADVYSKAKNVINKEITIKEKITPYEFIGTDNKRYKLDSVTTDFNKLSRRYGRDQARKLLEDLDNTFQEGQTYSFKISELSNYAGGIDDEGDFFRIDSSLVSNKLNLDRTPYRSSISGSLGRIFFKTLQDAPMPMSMEKIIGVKNVYTEWGAETVQSPYFRDWDNPISSFISPFYTMSANSIKTSAMFNRQLKDMFLESSADTNYLKGLVHLSKGQLIFNKLTGNVTRSDEYEEETKVHDLIEQMKYINGEKNIYELTGKEYLASLEKMVNEQDAVFLKDLLNVQSNVERKKILETANERLTTVLKMVWNRQQKALTGTETYQDWQMQLPESVNTLGVEFDKNQSLLKNRIKSRLGYQFSKLDSKRQGMYNAYVGSDSDEEFHFINRQLNEQYNSNSKQVSSIYPSGIINIGNY